MGTVDATDASDCPDTIPTRSALALKLGSLTEWQLGTLNGLPLYGVVASITVGANALTYAQRIDRRMRRTKIRRDDALEVLSAVLQFERQRHLQIHPLRDFVFVVTAGAVVVVTKLQTSYVSPAPLNLSPRLVRLTDRVDRLVMVAVPS